MIHGLISPLYNGLLVGAAASDCPPPPTPPDETADVHVKGSRLIQGGLIKYLREEREGRGGALETYWGCI